MIRGLFGFVNWPLVGCNDWFARLAWFSELSKEISIEGNGKDESLVCGIEGLDLTGVLFFGVREPLVPGMGGKDIG